MKSHSVLCFLICACVLQVSTTAANERPNIIFLMADDQRADSLGCTGNPIIQTPNIDELAAQGVLFDNAFVTTAICMTSRACVFTGQYAARHGIWSFTKTLNEQQLADSYLGQLKSHGYRTGFIGKWGVGHPNSANEVLDYNRGFPGQGSYFEGDVSKKQGRHLTARMGDQAIEFLSDCQADRPFHLSISFKAAHCQDSSDIYSDQFPSDPAYAQLYEDVVLPMPLTAANEFFDRQPEFLKNSMNRDRWAVRFRSPARFQRSVKDYYRLVNGIDTVVGRIRQELDRLGFAENTIIIYTSDHGFFLGEFGFAGKWTPHEVSIRIPLIVFDPRNHATRGTHRPEIALGIDFAPTILEYAGISAPDAMQGESLKPLVAGTATGDWRESFFYEHWFSADGSIAPSEAVRDSRWKYCRYLVPGKESSGEARWEELYDLKLDPHETTNLAAQPAYVEVLQRQRQAWEQWRASVR